MSSTATSETSCKHPQSDSVQSETKGKPVANNLTSLPQTIDSLVPVSEEREKELLLKINSYPKVVYHDPVARRFRRKLILRQVRLFQYPLLFCSHDIFRSIRGETKEAAGGVLILPHV